MLKCLYNGEFITSLNVRTILNDEKYEYKKGKLLELKNAGKNNQLKCECGEPVYLCAGPIRVPYFRHNKGASDKCPHDNIKESEEHRAAKELLYDYFITKYPDCSPIPDYRLPDNRIANLYVKFADTELVVEFERQDKSIDILNEKIEAYRLLSINQLWLLSYCEQGYERYRSEYQMHFYRQIIMNEFDDKTLYYLDVKKRTIVLVRSMQYKDEGGRLYNELYKYAYPLKDITILHNGHIESDYDTRFLKSQDDFILKCIEKENFEKQKRQVIEEEKRKRQLVEEEKRQRRAEEENHQSQSKFLDRQQQKASLAKVYYQIMEDGSSPLKEEDAIEVQKIRAWHKEHSGKHFDLKSYNKRLMDKLSTSKQVHFESSNSPIHLELKPTIFSGTSFQGDPNAQYVLRMLRHTMLNTECPHSDIIQYTNKMVKKDSENAKIILFILSNMIERGYLWLQPILEEIENNIFKK